MISSDIFPYEVPELHCHVRSDKDAFMFADKLADRLIEMGMPGIAITDHGVVSSIEDYRHVLEAKGLKVIPGCELYIDGGKVLGRQHGIVLAVDDIGWHGIGKIVTRANETIQGNYPVISADELKQFGKKYQGHIIFMTACIQGVISTIYLTNVKTDRLIEKYRKKQKKYIPPESEQYRTAEKELLDLNSRIESLKNKCASLKRLSEMKFTSREKKIDKLTGFEKEEALIQLDNDKKTSADAAEKISSLKSELAIAQKQFSEKNKAFVILKSSVEKYNEIQTEIDQIVAERLSDDEIEKKAQKELLSYVNAFGQENVYAEVQYHGIPEEAVCFPKIAALGRKLGVPLVATNDAHMLTNSEDDILRRCLIRSLRFGEAFEEPSESDKELYIKTTENRIEWLSKILPDDMVKEALKNAVKIFERCNVKFETSEHYPVASEDPKRDLENLVRNGKKWRFPDGFPDEKVYTERLKYELSVIEGMGYDNYHLVVREFLTYGTLLGRVPKERIPEAPVDTEKLKKWITANGWEHTAGYRIGTGRGSDGGSLVCFLLGITNIDPVKNNLLFERFLNPERVSMPDIDSDISADTRQKVINHCKYVYGDKAVCGIMTTNAQAPKGAIGIASKFYGLRKYQKSLKSLGNMMSKDVPKNPDVAFSTRVDRTTGKIDECSKDTVTLMDYLTAKWIDNNSDKKQAADCKNILHWASVMEGVFTSYGAHAAGIVIMRKGADVSDVLPLMWNKKLGMMTTQCSKDDVEANGLLKFDFLGLKTLDIITEALQMIQNRTGEEIDVLKLDIADENIYRDIFQTGNTKAVFQFESDGMRKMLKRFHPTEFSDLVLLNAAYRPGPMQYLDSIVEVKNGRTKVGYLTPELEPILKDTYGAMIYQEQVMQVCQSLAGYTFGGADLVRRAMSKKKKDKLAHEREAFVHGDAERGIKGCVANGIKEETADKIFDQMMKFASYAFNKSHAAAYAYNAYITAYLKEYYPAEFFAAALNWAADQDEINELIKDARACGIEIVAPDVNISGKDFTVADGKIYYALSAVKDVNKNAENVIAGRNDKPYSLFVDFLTRSNIDRKATKSLIKSGALDEFGDNRASMNALADEYLPYIKKYKDKTSFIASAEEVLKHINELETDDDFVKLQADKGLKAEIKSVCTEDSLRKRLVNAKKAVQEIKDKISSVDVYRHEDRDIRMKEEKAVLGAYVSTSPLDGHPESEDLGFTTIDKADTDCDKLYGYIEDISIKKRKKDGAEMAFFTLSDRTGQIECMCFANSFRKCRDEVLEGNVVTVAGKMFADENDTGEVEYKFSVYEISTVEKILFPVALGVKSYALFHIEKEDVFRRMYEDKHGHPLYIWDEAMDKFREMKYRVSDDILLREDVRKLV